ncbi:MAG TPA: hypothetical protein VF629_23195 [Hymenobacter sp.]|jgi:hypothetical protein|uniref:hypothetical protein n=1 Tax=Hymenobacter sp. TaxID=1898978 RepID=UPI002ED93AB3
MSSSIVASAPAKTAYQRPYKSRRQRREVDRRKYDEAKDRKFLVRMGVVVGLILIMALGVALVGMADSGGASAGATTSAFR